MLIEEELTKHSMTFYKYYSDPDMYIREVQTGILYEDAIIKSEHRGIQTFEETDIPLPIEVLERRNA